MCKALRLWVKHEPLSPVAGRERSNYYMAHGELLGEVRFCLQEVT